MSYRIRQCTWQSGERYCMLVDADTGMPPWYPMLFITTQFRNDGQSVATMEAALGAVQVLLDFTEAKGMDLEERALKREFLTTREIYALCDTAQRMRKTRRQQAPTVSIGHHYKRLTYIAQYLEWFGHEVLDGRRRPEDDSAIAQMVRKLRSRRPNWNGESTSIDRGLTNEQLKRLLQIIRPTHPDNPFADEKVAVRNHLAVLMLARLGVRRGELLGIQVGDIDWSAGELAIERRPDEKHDPRTRQPRAKTLARRLPLDPELLELLLDYVKGATFNDLFGDIAWEDRDRVRRLITEEIPSRVAVDPAFRNARKNSDRENARIEHDRALVRVMTSVMKDDTELFKQFMDNDSFKRWMTDTLFALAYEQAKTAPSGTTIDS